MRIALVIDSPPVCRYMDDLLGVLAGGDATGSRSVSFATLVVPALGSRGSGSKDLAAAAETIADRIAGFEQACLGIVARLWPAVGRRIGSREAGRSDIRPRFGQVIELSAGATLSFDTPPDVVLVLGNWLPASVLQSCPPTAMVLQVEVGAHPRRGLSLAGFEECYEGAHSTPVRLYRVLPGDRARQLLVDGHNRSKRLLSLNQAAAWDRAASILRTRLFETDDRQGGLPVDMDGTALSPVGDSDSPVLGRLAAYPLRLLGRGARLLVQQLGGKRRWSVSIHRQAAPGQFLGPPAEVEAAPPGTYYADPILYRDPDSGVAYCYVEEVDEATKRGHIAVLRETDGKWHRLGIALKEPFHLSFPYLFRFEGRLYMCPETGASGEIRVYRSTDFPLGWELETVLMRGVSATDTLLVPHAGRWWMLTNIDHARLPDHQSELHVFHGPSPIGTDWEPIPSNPVLVDCRGGRNGGLEVADGRIYRFGQVQSFDAYGQGLNRYEITRLEVDGYAEELRQSVVPPRESGAHGLHTHSSIDGWVAVDLLGAKA